MRKNVFLCATQEKVVYDADPPVLAGNEEDRVAVDVLGIDVGTTLDQGLGVVDVAIEDGGQKVSVECFRSLGE